MSDVTDGKLEGSKGTVTFFQRSSFHQTSNGRIKTVDRRIKQHHRKQTTIVAAKQTQQLDCPSFTFKRINNFKAAHLGALEKKVYI